MHFGWMQAVLLALSLAEPTGLAVQWEAPSECPDVAVVRAAVEDNLAREAFGEALDAVRVEGTVVRSDDGWSLRIIVAMPQGSVERTLEAQTCEDLASAAGLIIAVALDPLRVQQARDEPEPTPPPPIESLMPAAPTRVETAEEHPLQPEPSVEPAPTRPRSAVDLRVGAFGELGTLSVARGGVAAMAGWSRGWVRVDAGATFAAPRLVSSAEGVGVQLQQAALEGRGCIRPQLGAFEPSTCLGVAGGVVWGRGRAIETPQTTTLPWMAVVAGLDLAWVPTERVGGYVGVDGLAHVLRPQVRVDGAGTIVQTGAVGVRALAGLVVRWGAG